MLRVSKTLQLRLAFLLTTISLLFLLSETFFSFFYIQSDNTNSLTLSARRWHALYWHPINKQGYRDYDYTPQQMKGKNLLFVVGDSFAAGAGIKDVSDRFSNQLQKMLSPSWLVINMSQGGWNTRDELNAVSASPLRPRAIVLSYYLNDIEPAASQLGIYQPPYIKRPSPLIRGFVEYSYTLNFIYWRIYRLMQRRIGLQQHEWMKLYYTNDRVWRVHQKVCARERKADRTSDERQYLCKNRPALVLG